MATDRYVCETVDKSILGLKMDAHHSHDSVRRSYHSFRKITGSKLPQIVTTRRVHPPYTTKGLRLFFANGRSVVLCHPPPLLLLVSVLGARARHFWQVTVAGFRPKLKLEEP